MITNYLKIAWRNLVNNKVYSAINILGLAMGMAVALIIALWVYKEHSYDKFLPGYEQAYQVKRNFNSNGELLTFNTTSLKLADVLRHNIPEIEYVAETDWMGPHGLMAGERKLYIPGGITGSDFLKIFQFPLVEGTAAGVLQEPFSIVLTQSTAKALFDTEDAVGKIVRFDNEHDLKVTGILKDLPANSSFQFKFLVPFSYWDQPGTWVQNARKGGFSWNSFQQFVKLREGVSYARVAAKIKDIEKSGDDENGKRSDVILQSFYRGHLHGEYKNGKEVGGFIEYVRIFSVVGILVLLIACINFINLTTARSAKRGREVGIRKAIGSARNALVLQFLTESFLLTFLAFVVALLMVLLTLPAFNGLTGSTLRIPFANPVFWLAVMGGIVLTGLLAGSRPAFYLSSFNPVKTLKGAVQSGRSAIFSRKVLVVVQFSCSVALIVSTLVVYRQIQYAKDRPTGFQASQLIMSNTNSELSPHYRALKDDLLRSGVVQSVATASSPATNVEWHSDVDQWPGKYPDETIEMGVVQVDQDYFRTIGMTLQSGRSFTGNYPADSADVILNTAAVKQMRLKDPLNQVINFQGTQLRIIGVMKDALLASPYTAAEPMLFSATNTTAGYIMYRLAPGVQVHSALEKITAIFKKHSPAFPFQYSFVDEEYNRKFQQELLMGRLSGILAVLAIVISCLGLFGLAAYIAEQRTKEIGVRKVLGASVTQVWVLLSGDFVWLVMISCCIATPAAFYFLQHWLEKYDYRITMGPGVFIVAAVMALAITLATVSFQAVKAALADPVRSLRSE
ncbi:FtsX-like permease family protein [Chitinophaga agrisoli]|uniref:FtsX-like permease family protein n=1 Tax=Chitinophaga agrisoli TaxID=2607653 RepID=A0A5B2VM10_9BACT|nr:ABC transporter permease [Chitinophaga agrisoli]KAA2239546.1 FtsX-like permease family protein [Chitinophaga agrisoli]